MLRSLYLPEGSSIRNYEGVWNHIHTFSQDPDAKLFLSDNLSRKLGTFSCELIQNPMMECSYDVETVEVKTQTKMKYTAAETKIIQNHLRKMVEPAPPSLGVSIKVEDRASNNDCGHKSCKGTLKFTRVWAQPDGTGGTNELFEGVLIFKAVFTSLWKRKGMGSRRDYMIPFWAVRASEGVKEKREYLGVD